MGLGLAFAVAMLVYVACAWAGRLAGGIWARPGRGAEWLVLVAEGCGSTVEGVLRMACGRWRSRVTRVVVIDVHPADEAREVVERLAAKMACDVAYVAVKDRAEAEREVAAIRLGSLPDVRVRVIHVSGRDARASAAL
ncbi:hypothetical protein [Alicyclobacillus vulcanalis]|uniref:Uncharacterized protein n=1 Tax=Alicyclobacillus vulcanalis TaxID=252246 RepID=A0A1N7JND7_9BACL|nr:hypothetical protein [Alicyclobacillus vulcanalis]SIS50771.1 hypothetical protein SAMN05421799_10191 [Alicyclobacillus vulcanalis]